MNSRKIPGVAFLSNLNQSKSALPGCFVDEPEPASTRASRTSPFWGTDECACSQPHVRRHPEDRPKATSMPPKVARVGAHRQTPLALHELPPTPQRERRVVVCSVLAAAAAGAERTGSNDDPETCSSCPQAVIEVGLAVGEASVYRTDALVHRTRHENDVAVERVGLLRKITWLDQTSTQRVPPAPHDTRVCDLVRVGIAERADDDRVRAPSRQRRATDPMPWGRSSHRRSTIGGIRAVRERPWTPQVASLAPRTACRFPQPRTPRGTRLARPHPCRLYCHRRPRSPRVREQSHESSA